MVGKHPRQSFLIFEQAVKRSCRKSIKGIVCRGKYREGSFSAQCFFKPRSFYSSYESCERTGIFSSLNDILIRRCFGFIFASYIFCFFNNTSCFLSYFFDYFTGLFNPGI
jgi:hypothetical protein